MKKFLPFLIFSSIALCVAIILSAVFKFSLSNSWQSGVALAFVFGPYWVYGWRQSVFHKGKHPFLCLFARFSLILALVGYLLSVLLFFVVGW